MNVFFDILRSKQTTRSKLYSGFYACSFYIQAEKSDDVDKFIINLPLIFDNPNILYDDFRNMNLFIPTDHSFVGIIADVKDSLLLLKWLMKLAYCKIISRDIAYCLTSICSVDSSFIPLIFKCLQVNKFHCLNLRDMMLSVKNGNSIDNNLKDSVFDVDKDDLEGLSLQHLKNLAPVYWSDPIVLSLMFKLEEYRSLFDKQNNDRLKYIPYLSSNVDSLQSENQRIQASIALHFISHKGIKIDERAVHELRSSLLPKLHKIEKQLVEAGFAHYKNDDRSYDNKGFSTVHKDNKAIQRYLASNPNSTKTKNGNYEMTADALLKSGHQALEDYASFKDTHIIKTYLPFLNDTLQTPDHIVHPNFSHYSETGRVNGRDPNLLNLPREGGVRKCFVARDGFSFVFADYDGAEMRTFAQALLDIVGYSKLCDKYKVDSQFDPHSYLVAEFMNLDYNEVIHKKNNNDKNIKQLRQLMKAANFGFLGGLSSSNFGNYARERYGVMDITSNKSLELYNFYMKVFPEVKIYFNWIKNQTMNPDGIMDVVLPRSLRISGGKHFTQACNCFAQGVAADGALHALYNITEKCFDSSSVLFKSRPILFIHDEIITEVPNNKLKEASVEIKRLMELGMQTYTPDVPSACSITTSDRWDEDK